MPHWVLDALLGSAVTLGITLIIATDPTADTRADPVAYLFAVGFGALMLARRRFPVLMLVTTVLGVFAYYILDFPQIGVAVPVVAALYAATDAGRMVWAIGAGVVVFSVSMFFRVLDGTPIRLLIGYETVSNLALIAMAIALGASTRMHRLRTAQQQRINELTADRAADQAQLRIQVERERLSRDLHDTVGHTMSVISLQAGVAEEAIGSDDQAAIEAVRRIRETSGRTLTDVRSLVRLLRSDQDQDDHSLAELDQLLDTVRGAGIDVTTRRSGDPVELPRTVDSVGYRVVQEALTNIVRHSGARHADVTIRLTDGRLELIITDDGNGPDDEQTPGQGLIGMRERVRMLGGTVHTGPGQEKGFVVHATIPIGGGS